MVRSIVCGLFCLFFLSSMSGQRILKTLPGNAAPICELPAIKAENTKRISKPYRFSHHDRAVNYNITYVPEGVTISGYPCKTFPEIARNAHDYAVSIWSDVLNSENQELGILACWTDSLGTNTLGFAGPYNFRALSDPGFGLEPAYFPVSLAEYLVNDSLEAFDIISFYNASRNDRNLNYFRSPEQTMELHTPPTFTLGSSVSHFSEENLGDELMSPIFYNGQAIHTPNLAEIVLKEIGWNFIALPIQLLSFVVNEMEDGHFLEWKTDYEYNNDHFDIERSLDGTSFELVGEVPAIEEKTSIKSYAFLDTKSPQELSYYRLKQVDIDGSFSYSDTKTAFRKEKFAAWQLGPNPATEALELILPEQLKSYSLSFFDASGALQMTINGHENRQKIDISGLSPGIKYARLSDENGVIGWKNFLVVRP